MQEMWRTVRGLILLILSLACASPSPDIPPAPKFPLTRVESFPDETISRALMEKLEHDLDLKSLTVRVIEGIVHLTGGATSLREKDRARDLAMTTKGVRAVVNELRVLPARLTDRELMKIVREALVLDPAVAHRDVFAEVERARVLLSGKVSSWSERELVEWVARGVPGIVSVENRILVHYPKSRSDLDIANDIQGRIRKDPYLREDHLSVRVNDGKVTLKGRVPSFKAQVRASRVAWVNGVRGIDHGGIVVDPRMENLMMKDPLAGPYPDETIEIAVRDALFIDPRVKGHNPRIEVKDGIVILSGRVDNLLARMAAEQDAQNTVGVEAVENLLQVSPRVTKDQKKLKADVTQALKVSLTPEQRQGILVDVTGQVVTLTGEVKGPFVKERATVAAASVSGVAKVNTQLAYVRLPRSKRDLRLEERIQNGILWNPEFEWLGDRIDVNVHRGVAELTGEVDRSSEKRAAYLEAREAGAEKVINRIRVIRE